jgi:tRNA threonylcarbamoyladenosine modification (KEOPS) complex  Pcc1 subunit
MGLFFSPVMDLFSKYFFPVELEYVSDLMNKEKIKDKWNSISMESNSEISITARHTSLQTPIRGIDWVTLRLSLGSWHSWIDKVDKVRSVPKINLKEILNIHSDREKYSLTTRKTDLLVVDDKTTITDL